MPEWLWIILIGGVILGLLSLIYGTQAQKVAHLENCELNRPKPEEVMTKSIHSDICRSNMREVKDLILENRVILVSHVNLLKEHLDLKLERDILVELRKINGKK